MNANDARDPSAAVNEPRRDETRRDETRHDELRPDDAQPRETEPEEPLELDEMAALMRRQRRTARAASASGVAMMMLMWGVVWCLGFLVLWSGERGGNPWFRLPTPSEWITFGALMVIGIVLSAVIGVRMSRGVRGASANTGAMYGISWFVVMFGASIVLGGLVANGLSRDLTAVVAPSIYIFSAGVMYLVGAALWQSWTSFALGCCVIAVTCVAAFTGNPHHYLVYAIGGGVVLPLFAWLSWRSIMRTGDEVAERRR